MHRNQNLLLLFRFFNIKDSFCVWPQIEGLFIFHKRQFVPSFFKQLVLNSELRVGARYLRLQYQARSWHHLLLQVTNICKMV